MKKMKILGFLLILTILLPQALYASEGQKGLALTINAKSAVIMEVSSGKIIFEQNADARLSPASVTKVMTMLLIYEALAQNRIGWEDIVTVSDYAASMGGSQIFLEPGEQQNVRDLVKSIVIASANDAAVAMAEYVSGSEESFVDLMNKKARNLGMQNSSFQNACGLDAEGHFSSAKDIAIMSREIMQKYPEVQEYTTTWMDSITHKTTRGEEEFGLTNTNKLVRQYNGTTGLKTGSTSQALYCLSATASRGDMELIAVIMAAPDPATRFGEAMKMLDYGYANYKVVKGEIPGTVVGSVPVQKGKVDEVCVMIENLVSSVTEKGSNGELEAQIFIEERIVAPVDAGMPVGEIVYTYEGLEIGRSSLITEESVVRAGFLDVVNRMFGLWFR